mmetsp:Transcript_22487/g.63871  ORF Transcript_22487/g.63871 Transcript_22487/m.63871 type:complete len:206 (-) Transcript_22487:1012-1629(-)
MLLPWTPVRCPSLPGRPPVAPVSCLRTELARRTRAATAALCWRCGLPPPVSSPSTAASGQMTSSWMKPTLTLPRMPTASSMRLSLRPPPKSEGVSPGGARRKVLLPWGWPPPRLSRICSKTLPSAHRRIFGSASRLLTSGCGLNTQAGMDRRRRQVGWIQASTTTMTCQIMRPECDSALSSTTRAALTLSTMPSVLAPRKRTITT